MVDRTPSEPSTPPSPLVDEAQAALQRHAWHEAFDLLSKGDAERELTPIELDLLADAAWWTGRLPMALEVRERAYGSAMRAGDTVAAVRAAVELGRDNLFKNDLVVANAWLNRAAHLLEGTPENIGHGYLAACRSFAAALAGDVDASLADAERALAIGERFADRDLAAFAQSEKGFALVSAGRVDEGLALIDEATISAVGGELDPRTAGGVCCTSIEACAALGDWTRAASWTEAQDRWCRREGINGYPGLCRVFRSEIKQFRGSWLEAEAEARQASVELEGYMPAAAGSAFHRIGELRMLRGDYAAAEEALIRAHTLGTDAEPTMSRLRLAQGRTDAALAGIARALAEPDRMPSWRAPPGSALHRLPLLRAQVEIAIAAGEIDTAEVAAEELFTIAEQFGTPLARAAASTARGSVDLARARVATAITELRQAVQAWTALAAPYDAARARVLLAEAYATDGTVEPAILELHAARAVFERIGAVPELRATEQRLGGLQAQADREPEARRDERVVRTFVFTDIVDSTRLGEMLGDEAWMTLIRWHDQLIRGIVAEHGGEEIKATGDGFFLAFADADAAIQAMATVQRRLVEQRQRNGFAPSVRIGLHTAEAHRAGLDYLGRGVNYAARIGAAADAGEVLASDATLAAARRSFPEAPRRVLTLKGIAEPIGAASIPWS